MSVLTFIPVFMEEAVVVSSRNNHKGKVVQAVESVLGPDLLLLGKFTLAMWPLVLALGAPENSESDPIFSCISFCLN